MTTEEELVPLPVETVPFAFPLLLSQTPRGYLRKAVLRKTVMAKIVLSNMIWTTAFGTLL